MVAGKKSKTVVDIVKTTNYEDEDILKKSGEYTRSYEECEKFHLGEMVNQFCQRFKENRRGEEELTTNSLYAKHLIEEGHKFIDLSLIHI